MNTQAASPKNSSKCTFLEGLLQVKGPINLLCIPFRDILGQESKQQDQAHQQEMDTLLASTKILCTFLEAEMVKTKS